MWGWAPFGMFPWGGVGDDFTLTPAESETPPIPLDGALDTVASVLAHLPSQHYGVTEWRAGDPLLPTDVVASRVLAHPPTSSAVEPEAADLIGGLLLRAPAQYFD